MSYNDKEGIEMKVNNAKRRKGLANKHLYKYITKKWSVLNRLKDNASVHVRRDQAEA